jgi:hypothetical protein
MAGLYNSVSSLSALLDALGTKRSVFISYHHAHDEYYYDWVSRQFSETYKIIRDNSIEDPFESENSEYVMRKIREDHITGSSCTIVLCGPQTWKRKYVDWEIKATLDKNHGLIGVELNR